MNTNETTRPKGNPRNPILVTIAIAVALLIGVGIGAAATARSGSGAKGSSAASNTVASPTVVTVPTTVQMTKTVAPTAQGVPAECRAALDAGDTVINMMIQMLTMSGDAVTAADAGQSDQLNQITAKLNTMKPGFESQITAYTQARNNCRGD